MGSVGDMRLFVTKKGAVCIPRNGEKNKPGKLVQPGQEMPPGVLPDQEIRRLLDQGFLAANAPALNIIEDPDPEESPMVKSDNVGEQMVGGRSVEGGLEDLIAEQRRKGKR